MQRLGRSIWLFIAMLLVTVAVIFTTSNKVAIDIYLWPFDVVLKAPIWLVVLSSFIAGGLLSALLLWAQWLTIRTRLWRLQGKFDKMEAEMIQKQDAADIIQQSFGQRTSHYQSRAE